MEKKETPVAEPQDAEPNKQAEFEPQIWKISKPLGVRAGFPPIKVKGNF